MKGSDSLLNRKRRKAAKVYIWKYLKEAHWMHTLINSGQRMIDVWERNYRPVTFYFRSFETIKNGSRFKLLFIVDRRNVH